MMILQSGNYSFLTLIILLVVLFVIYFFVIKPKKKQQGFTEEQIKLRNPSFEIMWKTARKGVIIFMVIHFLYEILTGNNRTTLLLVIVNFTISRWFIKKQIENGKETENLLLFGLSVSCIVFLIRLLLGTSYVYMFRN